MDNLVKALDHLDVISAMYPLPGELELAHSVTSELPRLREVANSSGTNSLTLPQEIILTLHLPVSDSLVAKTIPLGVGLPLAASYQSQRFWIPHVGGVARACWSHLEAQMLAEVANVQAAFGDDPMGLLSNVIEWIQSTAPSVLAASSKATSPPQEKEVPSPVHLIGAPCVRAWFRFPTPILASHPKRFDIVKYATQHNLSGFVLAGKPGLLLLESSPCSPMSIAAFWKDIKTISWADIPSSQKKVSEVWRDEGAGFQRTFGAMEDITNDLGKKAGKDGKIERTEVVNWLRGRGFDREIVSYLLCVAVEA